MTFVVKKTFLTLEEDSTPGMVGQRSSSLPARLKETANDEMGQTPILPGPEAVNSNSGGKTDEHQFQANAPTTRQPPQASCIGNGRDGQRLTTIMLGNIPFRYSKRDIKKELFLLGLGNHIDFFHAPSGRMGTTRGYCFVNFRDPDTAMWYLGTMSGYRWKRHQTEEVREAAARWATIHGLEGNLSSHNLAASTHRV